MALGENSMQEADAHEAAAADRAPAGRTFSYASSTRALTRARPSRSLRPWTGRTREATTTMNCRWSSGRPPSHGDGATASKSTLARAPLQNLGYDGLCKICYGGTESATHTETTQTHTHTDTRRHTQTQTHPGTQTFFARKNDFTT